MPTSPSEPTLDTAETAPIDASPSELAAAKLRQRTGRNDPCPCGSGKKYKKCCLSEDEDLARKAVIQAQRQESAEPAQEGLETDELPQGETQPPSPETQERPIALNELSPETEAKLDAVWSRFESLEKPTTEQMDEVLRDLFDLPADATEWGQLLQQFSLKGHADLVGVFRRIAATVPHTGKTDMPFFYWAAAEVFAGRGEKELLSEVIAGFCRLDLESYDADALSHLENVLLAAEVEGPTLALAEHFLPIERADTGLMPHAVPSRCQLIFELRVGEAISRETTDQDPQRLAQEFIRGIDDGVGFDTAQVAAEIVRGAARKSVWIPADFDLVNEELRQNTQAWQDSLRLFGNLVRVAQEAWRLEKRPPASGLRGLLKLLESVYDWDEYRRGRKKKKRRKNLLEFLRPAELDGRIGQACHDLVGCDLSRVRLQFRAHEVLTAFAARHQLISASDADKVQTELTRLWHRFEE